MLGACANALVVRVVETGATAGLTLGLSPFQLAAIFVAAYLSFSGYRSAYRPPIWLDAAILVLVLVPSSAVSWLALALYAGNLAWNAEGERRVGALLYLAIAVAALWSSVLLKWLAGPVTTAEAFLVHQLIAPWRPEIVQVGNVVGDPLAHSLIVMTRCTTADALPIAAIAVVSVALLLAGTAPLDWGRVVRACAGLAAFAAITNLLRLAVMAWSAESYDLAHGPIGANVYDLLQTGAVLLLGNWASKP